MGLLRDLFLPAPREHSAVAEAVASHRGRSALVASAAVLTPAEAKKTAKNRRAWQTSAFAYRRALPEVGSVLRFLGNNSAHIRLYAGDRPWGQDEVLELTDEYGYAEVDGQRVRDPDALPDDLVQAARDALLLLTGAAPSGGGGSILSPTVTNFEAVGECWLVGRVDPLAGRETWAIHSVSELRWQDNRYRRPDGSVAEEKGYYRLVTGEGRGAEAVDLDPELTTCVRLWTADAEYSAEPDSPMRALIGVCEKLLLIERGQLAALRSRAAGNGFLLFPTEMDEGDDAADDDEATDSFQRDFTTQLVTPLSVDGSAAQVAPGIIRGPAQYLAAIRHLTLERPLDPAIAELEARLLARLGVGLDVPPEVVTGYADVNHWNVRQISEDTFKNHQEPITIAAVEALTIGYLRYRLNLVGAWDPDLIDRLVIWYDPASLITPPDRREAANDAKDRGAISNEAYLLALGFDPSDAPEGDKLDPSTPVGETGMDPDRLRVVSEIAGSLLRAGYEPAAVGAALGLEIAHTGLVPVTVKAPEPPAAPEQPALPAPPAPPAEPPAEEPPTEEEPPEGTQASAVLVAAAGPTAEQRRLSRRLMEIDRRLRERIVAGADAALLRALERAGNRLRSRAGGNEQAAALLASSAPPGERVAAVLGRTLVAALGADEAALLADAFARLRTQYAEWTTAAAEDAIDTAARLAGLDRSSDEVRRLVAELRDAFAEAAELGWPVLEAGLTDLATERLYDPDPSTPEFGELPDSLVPPGLVRAALAVAGGLAADNPGVVQAGLNALTGLTSGELLQRFLRTADVQPVEYEWAYGISSRPFPPHLALDGTTFTDFADPALSTAGFPGYEWVGGSLVPGDHKGCHCDFAVIYSDGGNTRDEREQLGRTAYGEQNPGRPLPTRRATVDGFAD